MSTRGQMVVPKAIRKELGFRAGDTLLCRARGGELVVVRMDKERLEALEDLFAWGERRAKVLRLRKRDVQGWVDEVRYGKK